MTSRTPVVKLKKHIVKFSVFGQVGIFMANNDVENATDLKKSNDIVVTSINNYGIF